MNLDSLYVFLNGFLKRRPLSKVRDIYKVLYQAFHGAEHGLASREQAWQWLIKEWDEIAEGQTTCNEELFENISIDAVTPKLYWVHLKMAWRLGVEKEKIFDEFIRTCREFPKFYPKETDNLHSIFIIAWRSVENFLYSGQIGIKVEDYIEFTDTIERNGWTAVAHSEEYRCEYDPHYRVIMDPGRILPGYRS